jgi:hypothetical protein
MNNINPIHNLHELKEAKLKLLLERASLEDNIEQNWSNLKTSLKPKNIINQWIQKIINEDQLRSNSFNVNSLLSGFITKKSVQLLKKVEEKISFWMK